MKKFFHSRSFYVGSSLLVIVFVISMALGVGNKNTEKHVTTLVEAGPVRELVSVSGIAKAEQLAKLAFPVSGIVESVQVKTGTEVEKGDVLITLDARALFADRQDALASLAKALADREELIQGPTVSARDVTEETLSSKKTTLETTIETENQKVANAYRTLLSSDLIAYSTDPDEDAPAPTVSGTYICEDEGQYVLDVYLSKADSGFSYKLTGLENSTYQAFSSQPAAIGTCGLRIQFADSPLYNNSQWIIDIPNTKSSTYITNRNAHSLAVTQAESAIAQAEKAVQLADADATNQNAPARSEAIKRADAAIAQAQAQLARIDSTIADRTLNAPFAGVITEVDILPGETVGTSPVVTLIASSEFEVTARIPEIDIGKLLVGQKVEMTFDARSQETVLGNVTFISPQATEIDGVAYYEAIIELETTPIWMRSGLNADIEIIIAEENDTLRVPKRFVTKTETGYEVLVLRGNSTASSTVEVVLEGNDGYIAITGLNEGDMVVAP